jgi:hypothetical protein
MRIILITTLLLAGTTSSGFCSTDLQTIDTKAYKAFTKEFQSFAGKGLPKDRSGLLGRNRKWGKLYSPRFQLGAGKALRITLVAGDQDRARMAYLGLKKGTEGIESSGYIKTTVPAPFARGRKLSAGDIASAAAFYLGDACLGITALETMDGANTIAGNGEINVVRKSLERGVNWLLSQSEILRNYDRRVPNRLLFDALAFQACGSLTSNEQAKKAASEFVEAAINLLNSEGYFLEGGGWDTSYQAVAINVGKDLLLAGFDSKKLEETLYKAALWLANRVDSKGRVNSAGNKRTCEGGESFLGKPKKIALDEVIMSLVYLGVMNSDQELLGAARRVSKWYVNSAGDDPCFAGEL